MQGPRLVAVASLALAAMCAALLGLHGTGEAGLGAVARATARTSLLLFCAAFAASALARLRPSPAARWLLRNRRYLGLSFAVSHGLHGLAVLGLAAVVPDLETDAVTLAGGGFAYLMIAVMAATSNPRSVALLGPRRWRRLHLVGGYAIWAVFASTYLPYAAESVLYLPFAALLVATLGLRALAALRAPRRAAVAA